MWQHIEYQGFEIHVYPFPKHSPLLPGTSYWYTGYVCRPSTESHAGGQQVFFSQPLAAFVNAEVALEAGYEEGKSIVDRVHPTRSVDDLK